MDMRAIALTGLMATLAACDGPGPVAEGANNFETAEIDVLPPDESVATPTDELANGVVNAPADANAAAANETP